MWLLLALVSPALWAIVHVLDSYCVNKIFDRPWIGLVTSSMTMTGALPLIIFALPFVETTDITLAGLLVSFLAGFSFMGGQILYFKALAQSESGIVAAYWNLLPLFLLLFSYFALGERLSLASYLGCLALTVASVSFALVDGNVQHRWRSFFYMCCAAILQMAYFLLIDALQETMSPYLVFLFSTVAMITVGLTPLLGKRNRKIFSLNLPLILKDIKLLFIIEAFNLGAVLTSQLAIGLGAPSVVSSVEASISAYTFLISVLLFRFTARFGECEALHRLPAKIFLTAMMCFGVWLVS